MMATTIPSQGKLFEDLARPSTEDQSTIAPTILIDMGAVALTMCILQQLQFAYINRRCTAAYTLDFAHYFQRRRGYCIIFRSKNLTRVLALLKFTTENCVPIEEFPSLSVWKNVVRKIIHEGKSPTLSISKVWHFGGFLCQIP